MNRFFRGGPGIGAESYPAYGNLRHGAGIPLTRKLEASVLEARSPGIGAEGYPAYGGLRRLGWHP